MGLSDSTQYDWIIASSQASKNLDALVDAQKRVDQPAGGSGDDADPERSETAHTVTFVYSHRNSKTKTTIFTPELLQQMCEVERVFTTHKDWPDNCVLDQDDKTQCAFPSRSVVGLFYGTDAVDYDNCPRLDYSVVSARERFLYDNLTTSEGLLSMGFFVDNGVKIGTTDTTGAARNTRSSLSTGGPLEGYDSLDDDQPSQWTEHVKFISKVELDLLKLFGKKPQGPFERSVYRDPLIYKDLRVRWFGSIGEARQSKWSSLVNS